jgi:hypothetical protein
MRLGTTTRQNASMSYDRRITLRDTGDRIQAVAVKDNWQGFKYLYCSDSSWEVAVSESGRYNGSRQGTINDPRFLVGIVAKEGLESVGVNDMCGDWIVGGSITAALVVVVVCVLIAAAIKKVQGGSADASAPGPAKDEDSKWIRENQSQRTDLHEF